MPKSTYLDNSFLNSALRNVAFTPPINVYLALFTVVPGVGGGGTEVSGGAYARQTVVFGAPVSGTSSNTADVNFPVATTDWGTIVAYALFDSSSGGNLLYFGNLTTSRLVLTSDQVRFPTGQLICSEA